MQAQALKGVLYLGLSNEDQERFEEIRNTPPTDRHKEWLYKKLTSCKLDYSGKIISNTIRKNGKKIKTTEFFSFSGYHDVLSHRTT